MSRESTHVRAVRGRRVLVSQRWERMYREAAEQRYGSRAAFANAVGVHPGQASTRLQPGRHSEYVEAFSEILGIPRPVELEVAIAAEQLAQMGDYSTLEAVLHILRKSLSVPSTPLPPH